MDPRLYNPTKSLFPKTSPRSKLEVAQEEAEGARDLVGAVQVHVDSYHLFA